MVFVKPSAISGSKRACSGVTSSRAFVAPVVIVVLAAMAWIGTEFIHEGAAPIPDAHAAQDRRRVSSESPVALALSSFGASPDALQEVRLDRINPTLAGGDRVVESGVSNAATPPSLQQVREALASANYFGKDDGLALKLDQDLSTSAREMLCLAHRAFLEECASITRDREPIVSALSQAKQLRGEVEPLKSARNMPRDLSEAEKARWIADGSKARLPTRPGQIVITVGDARGASLVRVDVAEDPRLEFMHERFENCRKMFIGQVRLALTYR